MAGGKAANLERLREWTRVPRFIVVTRAEVKKFAIDGVIEKLEIAGVGPPFAVRSSANLEDSENASFAGQFDTVLSVKPDGLEAALSTVLDSAENLRVKEYLAAKMLDEPVEIDVIVQRMVDAVSAGVALYHTEVGTEFESRVLVEAIHGLGDRLVDGSEEPTRWAVRPNDEVLEVVSRGRQMFAHFLTPGKVLLSADLRGRPPLSPVHVREISRMTIQLRKNFGWRGIDLEFAVSDGIVWCLQARPLLVPLRRL